MNETKTNDRPWATPPVDIFENEERFLVKADLPGVTADDVNVRFEQETLRIEAHRELAGDRFEFRRTFRLSGIDGEQISAGMKDGVLSLTLPKLASARPRQVPVTVP